MAQIKVTLVKSPAHATERTKGTLTALGLTKMNKSVIKEDTDSIRGMIYKVSYLVKVENI